MRTTNRKTGLDFIRGIAIILVLIRHSCYTENIFFHIGWLGVDLFFVLSGFLITGILLRDQENLHLDRFYYHRFLKIVPAFYLFIILSSLVAIIFLNKEISYPKVLSEAFFLQSYYSQIWLPTWSVAVEVHFYLFIGLAFYLFKQINFQASFQQVILFIVLLLICTFILRTIESFPHRHEYSFFFTASHLRCDGLLVGALFAYLKSIKKTNIWLKRHIKSLFLIGLVCIIPSFKAYAGGFFMNTVGLSITNIGFGVLVYTTDQKEAWFQHKNKLFKQVLNGIAFIGVSSYSIYLWHIPIKKVINETFNLPKGNWTYLIASLIIGVVYYLIVEKAFLKLKKRPHRFISKTILKQS